MYFKTSRQNESLSPPCGVLNYRARGVWGDGVGGMVGVMLKITTAEHRSIPSGLGSKLCLRESLYLSIHDSNSLLPSLTFSPLRLRNTVLD